MDGAVLRRDLVAGNGADQTVDDDAVKRGKPTRHDQRRPHEGHLVQIVELPLLDQKAMQAAQLPGDVRRVHDA